MTLSRKELIELIATTISDVCRLRACPVKLSEAEEFLSILDQAGMVIVPREPSETMLDEGAMPLPAVENECTPTIRHMRDDAKMTWQSMIEAALTDQQI